MYDLEQYQQLYMDLYQCEELSERLDKLSDWQNRIGHRIDRKTHEFFRYAWYFLTKMDKFYR